MLTVKFPGLIGAAGVLLLIVIGIAYGPAMPNRGRATAGSASQSADSPHEPTFVDSAVFAHERVARVFLVKIDQCWDWIRSRSPVGADVSRDQGIRVNRMPYEFGHSITFTLSRDDATLLDCRDGYAGIIRYAFRPLDPQEGAIHYVRQFANGIEEIETLEVSSQAVEWGRSERVPFLIDRIVVLIGGEKMLISFQTQHREAMENGVLVLYSATYPLGR